MGQGGQKRSLGVRIRILRLGGGNRLPKRAKLRERLVEVVDRRRLDKDSAHIHHLGQAENAE